MSSWETTRQATRPSSCLECSRRFFRDRLLQAELRHYAIKYGRKSAESEFNDRYGEWHGAGHPEGEW